MKVLVGGVRIAFLCFFASHIPITLCIDGQASLSSFYPKILIDFVAWYSDLFGDVLMRGDPYESWFSAIVLVELLLQLPFFFCATRLIWRYSGKTNSPEHYPRWFQKASLIYGAHTGTTLVPILATFLTNNEMSPNQKIVTIGVYMPYLIFPLLIMFYAWVDDDEFVPKSKKAT